MGYDIIPELKGYTKFADPNIHTINHGGIIAYVQNCYASHVFNLTYETCFIALRIDIVPRFSFIGTYIQPENSPYFKSTMFGELSSYILSLREKDLIPVMGGDINCRYGDLNHTFHEQNLSYSLNVDQTTNHHGRTYGPDMCNSCNIFPINHLKLGKEIFLGDFTYHKGNKKSQIDFVYTNKIGAKFIEDLSIPSEDWHLSDHRPITLQLITPQSVNVSTLIRRACELNYEFDPHLEKPTRYLSVYDNVIFKNCLESKFTELEGGILYELGNENLNGAFLKLEEVIGSAYKMSKVKNMVKTDIDNRLMNIANENYNKLKKCINGEIVGDKEELLKRYQESRNEISSNIFSNEQKKWNEATEDRNSKRLWEKISWNGNMGSSMSESPIFDSLTTHFENLYKSPTNEIEEISNLKSDLYVPELDKPISKDELDNAMKKMKNGGFDYKIDFFRTIVKSMSLLILMLLNIMFFISYPTKLAVSLLNTIPKKGNLSLPGNYRGIQMLKAFGVLYDRIINNRMEHWLKVCDEQSGFQKLRSTLHQIFTIRLLIEIAKMTNTTLYIGMFDLAKAFDKVSRLKLLKKLVLLGIGKCMLNALKQLYSFTCCIMVFGKQFSRTFRTFSGIRQGAASSALLFIAFIDDLVDYLKARCPPETILDDLHCLLHADDTTILNTDRQMFIAKCNHMLDYFEENSLSLNLSKSGYLIINGKENDIKCSLSLVLWNTRAS